jgi:hypothetical protein
LLKISHNFQIHTQKYSTSQINLVKLFSKSTFNVEICVRTFYSIKSLFTWKFSCCSLCSNKSQERLLVSTSNIFITYFLEFSFMNGRIIQRSWRHGNITVNTYRLSFRVMTTKLLYKSLLEKLSQCLVYDISSDQSFEEKYFNWI